MIGLAVQEGIVKKARKDGIAIECVSAYLLNAQMFTKSNFVTFVVAYASSEEAPEGQKAKYVAVLNSTVASVPAREHVFVSTHANANVRIEKRGERGGKAGNKVLGAYG